LESFNPTPSSEIPWALIGLPVFLLLMEIGVELWIWKLEANRKNTTEESRVADMEDRRVLEN
jgi:hypothetical protein